MRDNVTVTECCGWLMQIHICVKEKSGYFEHKLINLLINQWHINNLVDVINSWLLLISSRWIMLWNKAVFCLEMFTTVTS